MSKKRLLFWVMSLFLFLLFLELILRIGGIVYYRVSCFSQGMSGGNKSAVNTLLCLGDSFTAGFGSRDRQGYPEKLEKFLNDHSVSPAAFRVNKEFRINSSTLLKFLEADINKYKPSAIIIMTGLNDIWSLENSTYFPGSGSGMIKKINIWLSGFNVYKLARIAFVNARNFYNARLMKSPRLSGKYLKPHGGFSDNLSDPVSQTHFNYAEELLSAGNDQMALKEYELVNEIEPDDALVNFRIACINRDFLGNPEMAKKYAFRALKHGSSEIVGHIFMLLYGHEEDSGLRNRNTLREIKAIIEENYPRQEKIAALKILAALNLLRSRQKELDMLVRHNLIRIVKTIRSYQIPVIIMQYPMNTPVTKVIAEIAENFNIPLVDNAEKISAVMKEKNLSESDLFVRDGHCNFAGYGLIARNVYDLIQKDGIFKRVAQKEFEQ